MNNMVSIHEQFFRSILEAENVLLGTFIYLNENEEKSIKLKRLNRK